MINNEFLSVVAFQRRGKEDLNSSEVSGSVISKI